MENFRIKSTVGDSFYLETSLERLILLFNMGIVARAWHENGEAVIVWLITL